MPVTLLKPLPATGSATVVTAAAALAPGVCVASSSTADVRSHGMAFQKHRRFAELQVLCCMVGKREMGIP